MHLTRQAVAVIIRERNSMSAPVKMAPGILVATKVMPRSITDNKEVPRIPARRALRAGHLQSGAFFVPAVEISTTARYTTLIPKATHKNAGVRVITAVIRRKAAIMPRIILATTAIPVHDELHLQLIPVIFFTSPEISKRIKEAFIIIYESFARWVNYEEFYILR